MAAAKRRKNVTPAFDWKAEYRAECAQMDIEELERNVDGFARAANVDGIMGHAFTLAAMSSERAMDKSAIASEVLDERMEAARRLVE